MRRSLLLVEDNPDDADLTMAVLKQHFVNLEVTRMEDGVDALAYLLPEAPGARAPQLPDIVLLDLKLPRLDGHQVLKALRAHRRTRYLPVVILTSSIEDHDIERSYELGVNGYVQKPVNFEEFDEVAKRLGQYWLELNRISPNPRERP